MKLPEEREAFTHPPDSLVGVRAFHRQRGATIRDQRKEPWARVPKYRCGLIEEAFRLGDFAKCQGHLGHPVQRIPDPPRDRQRSETLNTASKVRARGGQGANGMFNVSDLMISLPKWAQPPVRYQICAVRRPCADTGGAAGFIKAVTGKAGRASLKARGFWLPPRK